MKNLITLFILLLSLAVSAQNSNPDPVKIRQQMAKIRQTTNWDDPAAAKKANEEIQKLAKQMSGSNVPAFQFSGKQSNKSDTVINASFSVKTAATKENIVAIADRFYKRSYKVLDAVSKSKFDQDFALAKKENFSTEAVRKLTSTGGVLLTLGNDHLIACIYLTAAVKALPMDTLSINNFGAYLRMVDSTAISVTVLLYANDLFSESPIILTQLGNSYFELNDLNKAESFFKQALKINPDFGQAHSALCDLYIKQKRLKDAIMELLAGVKGMGCSYGAASGNFNYLQQQAENSDTKGDFWDETKKQMNPQEALVPLVPEDNHLKMPEFPNCPRVEDWLEGGGWANGVQAYASFHSSLMSFAYEFGEIHKQAPNLPPNAVLRDYPNERLALDILTELFFNQANDDEKKYRERVDKITQTVNNAKELYINNLLRETDKFKSCCDGCGTGGSICIEKCHWEFCQEECPNANKFNEILRRSFLEWAAEFTKLKNRQKAILDDLYGFADPWFAKLESPYWSRIYAYEIKRVALSIIGNCYANYPQPFQALSHNSCETDCSIYANPFPTPPAQVEDKKPKENECPNIGKLKIPLLICEVGLDCESIEFGCTAGVAGSIKRNFRKKTTTGFLGVGVKGDAGIVGAGVRAGVQVTVTDNNEIEDVGARLDISASVGVGPAKAGITSTGSYTVMTGLKTSASAGFSPKFK